jgi:hypothetical protein
MCLESCPIETAASSDATSAKITESGAPPPLNAMPAGIESAVAMAGAMKVMDWNSTPLNPTAPLRSSGAWSSRATSAIARLPRRSGQV